MTRTPLTPDFIPHPWTPLASASVDGAFVVVTWPDGTAFRAYGPWLAENADGYGLEVQSRESMLDPGLLPGERDITQVALDEDGALLVTWPDRPAVRIHPGWLRYVAEGGLDPDAPLPEVSAWDADSFAEPPTVSVNGGVPYEALRQWLDLMATWGIARLRGLYTHDDVMRSLAERVGPIRATNFGDIFVVELKADPDSTAYTGLSLGQHTDLPSREVPPGYQFLHCAENTVTGGHSRMTDGMSLVVALEAEQPEAFASLTRDEWIFMNRAEDAEHRFIGPMIELPRDHRPLTIRAFYPVRSAPYMDESSIPAAYDALRVFSQYAHDPRFQISYPFEPGDLVGFDNRRVLHGRDSFESDGNRRLVGCYIDRDDVLSRLRVMNRRGDQT